MTGDKGHRVWEEVRRAMGRLASRAAVHELSPQISIQSVVKRSEAAMPFTVTAGSWEDGWRPQTETLLWPPPRAEEGGKGVDLATVTTVISTNNALDADSRLVQCPPWRIESEDFPHMEYLRQTVLSMPGIIALPIRRVEADVRKALAVIARGSVHLVPVPRLALEKERRRERVPSWALRMPRSQADLGILARVPIIRERLAAPPGQSFDEAFADARQQLALAAKILESDVALVGVFPQVPLNMVQKMSVTAQGGTRLQIWLKPEAVKAEPGGAKLATIILGRQRSTGRTLQAVSRTTASNSGSR